MKQLKRRASNPLLKRLLFGSDHQLFAWFELLLVSGSAMLIWVYLATINYTVPQEYFYWPMVGPVLIALRYGFGRGMMCFVLLLVSFSLWQTANGQHYLMSMPVAVGTALITMLVGEFRDHWHDINERFELNHRYMEQKLKSFTQNYHLLKVSHDQLEQRVAGKQMSLRTGIQLLQHDIILQPNERPTKLAERSLQVMTEIITFYQAGFYQITDGKLNPNALATIGNQHQLVSHDPMLLDALSSKALLSPADLIEHANLHYQLVVPLVDLHGQLQGIVLAEKVKFVLLTDANIALLALLAGYIANYLGNEVLVPMLKPEQRQLFKQYLRNQQAYKNRYGIDSSLVVFTDLSKEQSVQLRQVMDYRRGADIYWACHTADHRQALCVMLPITTLIEAKQFIERVKSILQSHSRYDETELQLTGPLLVSAQQAKIEQLLNELGANDEDLADTANHFI